MAPPGAAAKHFHDLNRSHVDILTVPFVRTTIQEYNIPIVMKIFNCSNTLTTYWFCLLGRKSKILL